MSLFFIDLPTINSKPFYMKKNYFFTLLLTVVTSLSFSQIVINEIDADQTGTDNEEFIELLWTANTSLDGYVVVLYNGSSDTSYDAYDLDGYTTNSDGLFLLASSSIYNAATDIDLGADNGLQNGADAVAVYQDDASSFPGSTAVTQVNLIAAIVYDTSDGDDSGLLTGLGLSIQYNENENSAKDTESIQRKSDGTYEVKTPTRNVLSISKNQIEGFSSYPNPVSNGKFTISSMSSVEKTVSIFNLLGKQVLSDVFSGKSKTLDIASFSTGIYILKVNEGNKTSTRKVVIK